MTEPASASLWSVGGRSVMGASHVLAGIPNQDAIRASSPSQAAATAVLALADGHGAAIHFRSGIGAHIAVEVATGVLADALADTAWIAAADQQQAQRVVHAIVARWRHEVREHLTAHPIGPQSRWGGPDEIYLPYGSTLIAAAACPAGFVVLQIGDGDLMLGRSDGTFVRPLPDDEGMIGEQTYSLCQDGAEQRFRVRVLRSGEADIDLIMLSTDGLAKSYASRTQFEQLAGVLRQAIATSGLSTVCDGLDRQLSEISELGSGDDITLGFLIRSSLGGDRAESDPAQPSAEAPREWQPRPSPRGPARWRGLTGRMLAILATLGAALLAAAALALRTS